MRILVAFGLLALAACGLPGKKVDPVEGDFAFLEIRLTGATGNEQLPGLFRTLGGLYNSDPNLDIEQQIARVRVLKPRTFDFVALLDGFTKNNFGIGDIKLQVVASVSDGHVRIEQTGQTYPLRGDPPPKSSSARRWLRVRDWSDQKKTGLEVIP